MQQCCCLYCLYRPDLYLYRESLLICVSLRAVMSRLSPLLRAHYAGLLVRSSFCSVLSVLTFSCLALLYFLVSLFLLSSWLRHNESHKIHSTSADECRVAARGNLIYVQHQGQIIEVHSAIGRRLTLNCCC